jgi:hypothetical protein
MAMLILSGCFKDDFDFDRMKEDMITWEPDIAFPVVYSIMTAQDMISSADSTNIYEYDSDNFITLIYRKRIFSQTVNDFFQLPQFQSFDQPISLTATEIGNFSSNGSVQKTVNSGLTMSLTGPGGSQLDKVLYESGFMNISFSSEFQHSGSLEVSMPEMRLNGVAYVQSFPIVYTGGTVTFSIDIPLAGYEMDLNNGGGANTIPINYELTLNEGNGSTPTTSDLFQVSQSFQNLKMAFADGDFGNFNLLIDPADVDLDVVQSEHDGYLYFEDPRLRLSITNSIGASIAVTLNQFYATGPQGQQNIDLSALIPSNQFTVPAAPSIGNSSSLEYYFTKDNSNIQSIINDQYENLHHELGAVVNPGGPTYNFAALNSAVEVVADVELPFWGYSNHFTIIDTLEVPFDDVNTLSDNIERALLRINTVSHFPVDGLLKLYFADSSLAVIDSVLTDGSFVIRSGVVNADGKTITATQTNNDIELDTQRINSLFASRFLLIYADITSTDNAGRNIKLYTEDNIEVRIGLRVKLKASPSVIDEF